MKGATAEPWLKTISPPNEISTINIGSNQNFFLIFKKFHNSIKKDIFFKIDFSLVAFYLLFLSNKSYYLNLILFLKYLYLKHALLNL